MPIVKLFRIGQIVLAQLEIHIAQDVHPSHLDLHNLKIHAHLAHVETMHFVAKGTEQLRALVLLDTLAIPSFHVDPNVLKTRIAPTSECVEIKNVSIPAQDYVVLTPCALCLIMSHVVIVCKDTVEIHQCNALNVCDFLKFSLHNFYFNLL